jgi:hypothetical protein
MPIIPAGQSASLVHVGIQAIPIGVEPQVQPTEPGGHAPTHSDAIVQALGPIIPVPLLAPLPLLPLLPEPIIPPVVEGVPW